MAKQYKAGQLVTINKKVYRIRKRDFNTQSGCYECAFQGNSWGEEPCAATCPHKMYYEYYFELIITKRNLNISKRMLSKQEIRRTLKNDGFIPHSA